MITNSIKNDFSEKYLERTRYKGRGREKEITAHNDQRTVGTSVYESDKINVNTSATKTTAGLNPSGRLSFKGANAYVSKYANKTVAELENTLAGKLVKNRVFNWFIDQTSGNTLITEALVALGLTAIFRPLAIAALPAKDEKDKMKNKYQIGQAISTGIVGLGLTFLVSEPIKRSFSRLLDNPQNFLKKNLDLTSKEVPPKVKSALKETTIRLVQPVFLPLKAKLTIMMIPPILAALGIKKIKSNPTESLSPAQKAAVDYSFMSFKGDSENKKIFQNFAGNATKINKNQQSPSFKANLKSLINADIAEKGKKWNQKAANVLYDTVATAMGKVIDTKTFKNFINWFKDTNFMPHLIAGESLWLTGFYANETRRSKNIEKDQKLPLVLNQVITTGFCTAGAYGFDGTIKNKMTDLQAIYKKLNPNMPKEVIESKLTGIKLLAPVVIFTVIYRFIGPVVVTPIANAISNKIQNRTQN